MYVHLTLVPYLASSGEIKTKPTQHSVKELREIGIQPDIIICRSEQPLSKELKKKIGLFCSVSPSEVIEARDVESIYEVPINLEKQGFADLVVKKLNLKCGSPNLDKWKETTKRRAKPVHKMDIAVCGKYTGLHDAYKSILEAFVHAGIDNDVRVNVRWVDSEEVTGDNAEKMLKGVAGLLIPGGFGDRGIEGKINAIKYTRENNIPFFGICLGMQCAVIEFARNVLKYKKANSSEFDHRTNYPVIDLMYDQRRIKRKGGTMRLGEMPCHIQPGSLAYKIYGRELISERHRHRYEVNNEYRDAFEEAGLKFGGLSPDHKLVEMVELPDHPWFLGCQFHPELKSRFTMTHPLFRDFIRASLEYNLGEVNAEEAELKA